MGFLNQLSLSIYIYIFVYKQQSHSLIDTTITILDTCIFTHPKNGVSIFQLVVLSMATMVKSFHRTHSPGPRSCLGLPGLRRQLAAGCAAGGGPAEKSMENVEVVFPSIQLGFMIVL